MNAIRILKLRLKVRELRDKELRSLKKHIDFNDDPSRFIPINEILKEIQ